MVLPGVLGRDKVPKMLLSRLLIHKFLMNSICCRYFHDFFHFFASLTVGTLAVLATPHLFVSLDLLVLFIQYTPDNSPSSKFEFDDFLSFSDS